MHKFSNRNYIHAFYGILTLLIPFLISIIINNNWIGVMGAFGALIFMYYLPINKENTMNQLLIIVIISTLSFPVSAIMSRVEWIGILWIALLAFIVQYIINANNFIGPGVFFILMINGMLTSLYSLSFSHVILFSIYAIVGAYISFFITLIENNKYEKYKFVLSKIKLKDISLEGNIKALIIGIFSFVSYFIGYHLNLNNYYWILVSALTILQSENITLARKRQLEYIYAGIVGTFIAFIIYSFISSIIILSILSMIFMGLICLYMPKSYLIGNFFTTPIALILFKIVRPDLGNELIGTRILAILIGTIIGLLGVWYHDRLKI